VIGVMAISLRPFLTGIAAPMTVLVAVLITDALTSILGLRAKNHECLFSLSFDQMGKMDYIIMRIIEVGSVFIAGLIVRSKKEK
jgi:hypothetical protein